MKLPRDMDAPELIKALQRIGYHVVRLAAALGTSERFWLGLQADYDLEEAHRILGKAVTQIERIAA